MTIIKIAPTAITQEMLTAESERRLSVGFDFNFADERGVHRFGTTPQDMKRWTEEVTPLAQAASNTGNPDRLISIKTDTGPVDISASEWWIILNAAGAWRQPIYAAYFLLKSLSPIPNDYAVNDQHWRPSV